MAAGGGCSNVPQYEDEASETNTQIFHVASLGAAWRGALRPQDLSVQQAEEGQDAAAAEELGCPPEMVPELRAVCR